MSFETFSDDCPGCRPAMMDAKTGEVMADDSPPMKLVLNVWRTTSRKEREVFHRVCCQNSRNVSDMMIFTDLTKRIQNALNFLPESRQ